MTDLIKMAEIEWLVGGQGACELAVLLLTLSLSLLTFLLYAWRVDDEARLSQALWTTPNNFYLTNSVKDA